MKQEPRINKHLQSSQVIILGFLLIILTGTLLLMLPISTRGAGHAGFLEALFTSTSATCVTGLVVQDTATYWSGFGQFVILLLIQIGGMGVITFALAISMLSGRRIGLMQRTIMQSSISAPKMQGIVQLTRFILITALAFEVAGAVIMAPVFIRDFGFGKGLWYALFHSISAFCNAGFDLMGVREKFGSLTSYSSNPVINFTIMALIIIGGIGFLTWYDFATKNKTATRKYSTQTKLILRMTAILIVFPALYFYFSDFRDLPEGERVLNAFFQSVTARTAGFNTADLTKMTQGGLAIMIFLMLTGGSPGSTAGGMKNTTLAVLFASAFSLFHQQKDTNLLRRRVEDDAIRTAGALLLLYLTFSLAGAIALSELEHLPMLPCLFETASAIGTVGLSLGLTTKLHTASRLILIVLMYFGRVGGLTILFAALQKNPRQGRNPKTKIMLG